MRVAKKIAVVLLCLLVLLVIANFALSAYITKKLPSIIHAEKNFPYNVSYKDLDLNLLTGSFTIHDAYIAPKDSVGASLQEGAFAEVKAIEVRRFNLWALLKDDRISVKKVIIDSPDIILYPRKKKYNTNDDLKPLENAITTGSLEIRNGKFSMVDSLKGNLLSAVNINFELNNIRIDSNTVEKNIPVRYRDYRLECDSLFYRADKFYNVTAGKFSTTDSTVAVTNFKMIPKQTRVQFTQMMPKEKDQFAIVAEKISIPKADWGYLNDTLYVHSPEITLEKVNANIYRNKLPKDDPTIKKLYSEMLRSLKFDLKVDKLLLKNSTIVYEEQLDFKRPPAKVSFSKFYATVSNIYSPVRKDKLPGTTIDVKCLFMKSTPLEVNWSFNIQDVSDSFVIKARLQNIRSEEINPISKPLMNATTTGSLKKVYFTMNGNRNRAEGDFAINYEDLKVEIYDKDDQKKKKKLVSALGNLVVKDDTKGELKEVHIGVDRNKDKSVFNFIWNFAQEGLTQTVLPKPVAKIASKKQEKKRKKK
jgi:predicted component of type VI protein secretion system